MSDQPRESRRISRSQRAADPARRSFLADQEESMRPSRRVRRRPIIKGEIVTIAADSPVQHLTFRSPSGFVGVAPVDGSTYALWVPEAGTWTYRWDDGEMLTLEVVEQAAAVAVADPGQPVLQLPKMIVARAPRH